MISGMQHLYCYVDETGQDTKGRIFLVAVVIAEGGARAELEGQLLAIEEESVKRRTKWQRATFERRLAYLQSILRLEGLQGGLFYATH